jgi:hypothetical protein
VAKDRSSRFQQLVIRPTKQAVDYGPGFEMLLALSIDSKAMVVPNDGQLNGWISHPAVDNGAGRPLQE